MNSDMQELTMQEASAITGGNVLYEIGRGLGWAAHAVVDTVVDAFLTPQPANSFNWARDK